jgi:hypothetical protein
MKTLHGVMIAGIAGAFAVAALLAATSLQSGQSIATGGAKNAGATGAKEAATAIPIDASQAPARFEEIPTPGVFERARSVGFTLDVAPGGADSVLVAVEPCWLERQLPELPTDYRDLLEPDALICADGICLAGRGMTNDVLKAKSSANTSVVDPVTARISYVRNPDCAKPTAAP